MSLVRTLNPRKRKYDERIAAETVRAQVGEALRRSPRLGFVDILDDARLACVRRCMRFAEPVRGLADPNAALERLVARGEVLLGEVLPGEANGDDAVPDDAAPDDDGANGGNGGDPAP